MTSKFFSDGYCILKHVFSDRQVAGMRQTVLAHAQMMGNTRPNPNARHLAGFHRFEQLAALHQQLAEATAVALALDEIYENASFDTIGLSDITINRSQPWHTDLLRGKYATFLEPEICWGAASSPCIKALLYLQDGTSLKVIPGSQSIPISLVDDHASVPTDSSTIQGVPVSAGDVILMDIRLVHRGSTEEETNGLDLAETAKILISTVFGATSAPLTDAMAQGNQTRLADWDSTHMTV